VKDSIPAAVRSVHQRAETVVVAGAERLAVPVSQCLHTGCIACINELEDGHKWDY
jgi:hypothetical protein